MTNQEYSFIEGFIKRASEYGYDEIEAIEMLKSAGPLIQAGTGAITGGSLATKPAPLVVPKVSPQDINGLGAALSTPAKGPAGPTYSGGYDNIPPAARAALRLPTPPPEYFAPKVNPAEMNDAMMQPGQRSFTSPR